MVEGSGSSNGNRPWLRVIRGELIENPRGRSNPPGKFTHLANGVEPIVQGMIEAARETVGARERIGNLCLIALIRAEVGGDAVPMLREAAVVADSIMDRLLAAELMVQVAEGFWRAELDPWPVMDMAFRCAQEAPQCGGKEEVLAGVAYSYAVLGDYPRAERIMDMLADFELRKNLKAEIDGLISSQAGE